MYIQGFLKGRLCSVRPYVKLSYEVYSWEIHQQMRKGTE